MLNYYKDTLEYVRLPEAWTEWDLDDETRIGVGGGGGVNLSFIES